MTDGDNCGDRKTVYEDDEIIVEDYCSKKGAAAYRRLIATSDPSRLQSVIKLQHTIKQGEALEESDKKWGLLEAKKDNVPDKKRNLSEIELHNLFMVCAQNFQSVEDKRKGLVLGGGCGVVSDLL